MIVVVAATRKELAAFFARTEESVRDSGLISLDNKKICQLCTGVGIINSAAGLSAFVEKHSVSGVLNIGIAGSYEPESLPVGSLAVAEREIWPEFGVRAETGPISRLDFPLANVGREKIFETIELDPDARAGQLGVCPPRNWPRKTFLTVSGVSGTAEQARELGVNFKAQLENMEGFALALVAARAGIPFLEIRSVSNIAGSRAKKDWDFPLAFKALQKAGATLF
ncbi:MAG: futalosine hydrolase [Thermodesulfobacteriota bacterium]